MADVRRHDRAQLLLVGALALAVILLSLSMLLNSVIFTENLATRQTHADAEKVSSFESAVVEGVGGAIEHANRRDTTTFADRNDTYYDVTNALIPTLANYSATDGVAAGIERDGVYQGTRIVDANRSSGLTNRANESDWTMVNDSRVRAFRLQVNVSSVESGDEVHIQLDNGTTHEVIVEPDGGGAHVRIERPGDTSTCALEAGRIDVTAGSVDGEYCRGLAVLSTDAPLDEPVNVSVTNGDQIQATYSLVVDRHQTGLRTAVDADNYPGGCSPPSPPTYGTASGDDPYTTPAIYAATTHLDAGTTALDYQRTLRLAPDEVGPAATGPTFTTFNVTAGETSTIDWKVADPDGSSDVGTVNISMAYASNGTGIADQTYNGDTDQTTTFTGVPNDTAVYVNGSVSDGASLRRVTERHDTGGCSP